MPSRRELIALTDREIGEFLQASKSIIIDSNGKDGHTTEKHVTWDHAKLGAKY